MTKKVFTVDQINRYLKNIIEEDIILQEVFVSGEISNFKDSKHLYFTLKEENSTINCVMFSGRSSLLKFKPENGMRVILFGRVGLYEKTGSYQIYVDLIEPEGVGPLQLAFEQLKSKLSAKGYFDVSAKKQILDAPKTIALITSPTGAVVKDMISVAKRRDESVKLIILPTLVQGRDAPQSIADAILDLEQWGGADVAILARGGGSREDLWAFNEEIVADAIFHAQTPIVSAVGHETDFTIADFVADLRAPTPSAAMEMILPLKQSRVDELQGFVKKLNQIIELKVGTQKNKLMYLTQRRIFSEPTEGIEDEKIKIQGLTKEMSNYVSSILARERAKQKLLLTILENLSPLTILRKGYALVYTNENELLKSVEDTQSGDVLKIHVQDGNLEVEVRHAEKTDV